MIPINVIIDENIDLNDLIISIKLPSDSPLMANSFFSNILGEARSSKSNSIDFLFKLDCNKNINDCTLISNKLSTHILIPFNKIFNNITVTTKIKIHYTKSFLQEHQLYI